MSKQSVYPERWLELPAGRRVRVFSRHEFLTLRFGYNPGEHVLFVAPSQDGKTTLAFQMLMHAANKSLPAYVLVMKPRDPTPATWIHHLGYREVPTWPAPPRQYGEPKNPVGIAVWPHHTFNARRDNLNMQHQFSRLLAYCYGRGNCIVFADEVYGLIAELRADRELIKEAGSIEDQINAILTRGGGMGAGLWSATQKASGTAGHGLTGFLFSNAVHFLFSRDPTKGQRDKYADVSGIDIDLMRAIIDRLGHFQFGYARKADSSGGPYICVIDSR